VKVLAFLCWRRTLPPFRARPTGLFPPSRCPSRGLEGLKDTFFFPLQDSYGDVSTSYRRRPLLACLHLPYTTTLEFMRRILLGSGDFSGSFLTLVRDVLHSFPPRPPLVLALESMNIRFLLAGDPFNGCDGTVIFYLPPSFGCVFFSAFLTLLLDCVLRIFLRGVLTRISDFPGILSGSGLATSPPAWMSEVVLFVFKISRISPVLWIPVLRTPPTSGATFTVVLALGTLACGEDFPSYVFTEFFSCIPCF